MKNRFFGTDMVIAIVAVVMVFTGSNAYALCTTAACLNGDLDACQCLCDQDDPLACDRLPNGGGSDGGGGSFTCTEVIGFSQTDQWFEQGRVESFPEINNAEYQLRWQSGGGIEKWGVLDTLYSGWTKNVYSPCTVNSNNPDRVIFNVSSSDRDITAFGISDFVLNAAYIASTQSKNLKEISFITVIGGPNGAICQVPAGRPDAGRNVSATTNHSKYENGIEMAVALTMQHPPGVKVLEGMHPEVGACHWYGDAKGHLQTTYTDDMAERMADIYLHPFPSRDSKRTGRP